MERIAASLVALARGAYTAEVARAAGVSTVTVLNWMDWSWKHRAETEEYLRQHFPDLRDEELQGLWNRIRRRRAKRQRRLDLTGVLSGREPQGE